MKFEVGKRYITRDGHIVRITDYAKDHELPFKGVDVDTGANRAWSLKGMALTSGHDIISVFSYNIQLEVGKTYMTKDGSTVEITKKSSLNPIRFEGFIDNVQYGILWDECGKSCTFVKHRDLDIITEVPDDETETQEANMNIKLDLTKPVQTKDGKPVRILCTDAKNTSGYSVVGLIGMGEHESMQRWKTDGTPATVNTCFNLVNVPEKPVKVEMWINVYPDYQLGAEHSTRTRADSNATKKRIGIIRIEWIGDDFQVFKEEI